MSSEPSLLFVLNSFSVGGSEIKTINVANALARSGTAAELAYLNPIETSLSKIDPAVPVTFLDRRGKYSFSSLGRLRDLVNGKRQTVVAVNLYPLLYVIPVVKWWKLKDVRAVGLVNTIELVGRERIFGGLFAYFLKQCDQVVFGCESQRTHWIRKYGLPQDRSQVIYNGVDHRFYSPANGAKEGAVLRAELGISDDVIVVGSVGRLAPEKNYESLILALAKLKAAEREFHAILAGRGPEQRKLETMAATAGIANQVHFLGVQSDVRPVLAAMDIFVLPSKAVETFSNAALEAMAMARAVVLSKMGGAAEMVQHEKSGMLFDARDVDTLANLLATLYESRDIRERLGEMARKRVIASFNTEAMIDNYRKLLQLI